MNDREKLIELLGYFPVWPSTMKQAWMPQAVEKLADHLLANGVTVQRWIPVTERLPVEGVLVLAAHDDGVVRIGSSRGDYFPSVVSRTHTKAFGIAEVTHWMPLPEPPNE